MLLALKALYDVFKKVENVDMVDLKDIIIDLSNLNFAKEKFQVDSSKYEFKAISKRIVIVIHIYNSYAIIQNSLIMYTKNLFSKTGIVFIFL